MSFRSLKNPRIFLSSAWAFYFLLIIFTCLPIWFFAGYFNQDGLPHLYNAYLIIEILKGNPAFTEIYALNPAPLPNLTGHYLLAFLLLIFSPSAVTKIMVTFTFAGFVAAIGWLRLQVAGRENLKISFLIGAALAFNWMWFLGFYNFIIGVICYAFTLGLYWRWREELNLSRAIVLSILLIAAFLSHLISFGMLAGSIVVLGVFVDSTRLRRTLIWTFAAFLPVIPLILGYKLLIREGGSLSPNWQYLSNPLSASGWVMQLQTADPFQLLSRKTLPFLTVNSNFYAFLSPVLWLTAALICLLSATFLLEKYKDFFSRQSLPFVLILAASIFFWIFAPDDFGKSHGSFLRERVLLCGLICFVPIFKTGNFLRLKYAASACLVFVVAFQTAALWEYAIDGNRDGQEYLSAQQLLADDDSLASIMLIDNGCRFKSSPLANINVLNGIGKNARVWDNYEISFYLFPVVAKNPDNRQFIFDYHAANVFEFCDANDNAAERFSELDAILESHNDKIKTMLIWGNDERIAPILNKWYENQPVFQNGKVRLFRHR